MVFITWSEVTSFVVTYGEFDLNDTNFIQHNVFSLVSDTDPVNSSCTDLHTLIDTSPLYMVVICYSLWNQDVKERDKKIYV